MQGDLSTFRMFAIVTPTVNPTDGSIDNDGTPPLLTMSPVSGSGMLTTGLLFMLKSPPSSNAVAGAGGFTVTPWIRDPVTQKWASGASFSADYDQMFSTFDFDACDLYFTFANVAADGIIFIGISEQ